MIKTSIDAYGSTIHTITSSQSQLCINATRGGIPISWQWQGKEIFYNDTKRYADASLPIWGGIPILFPSLGKLAGGSYHIEDATYPMPAHGFVRDMEWKPDIVYQDGVSFSCQSNAWSRQYFPYDFLLTFRYILRDNILEIRQSICNTGDREFAFAMGLHPYFATADREKVDFSMKAATYENLLDHTTHPYEKMSFAASLEEICYLLQNERSENGDAVLDVDLGGTALCMRYSKEYKHVIVWSVKEDFICIEPWSARVNALHTGEDLIELKAGETKELFLSLEVTNTKE